MAVTFRNFQGEADFTAISDFLTGLYQADNRDGNWFQAVWEYAYTHPMFDSSAVSRIGIWEENGHILAVATYESRLGEAFFNVDPEHQHLKPEMLAYAEEQLSGADAEGRRYLKAFVNDSDRAFEVVGVERGYRPDPREHRPTSQFVIPDPFPPTPLPEGFRLQSLADENDLHKINRVLYRGFDHPGEPPEEYVQGRAEMQRGPHYRKDLTIVTLAPNGDYASFCGMWYDATNRFGYVEPVATDPSYRRRGLGRAAVLEAIRRVGEEGATVAYVGSDQPFYLSFGFKKLYSENCWLKYLD